MGVAGRHHDILLNCPLTRHQIILDCDPGVDDAVAIMLALASPEIALLGITCVAGNVGVERTSSNAARICALMGRSDVPVLRGCKATLLGEPMRQAVVHGKDGLGDIGIASALARPAPGNAVDFLIGKVMDAPAAEITLCVIGPMTNVATAFRREPRLPGRLERLVFMGGAAFGPGNTTEAAEFNIRCDPDAAQAVLDAGIETTMFGLDVTRKMRIDAAALSSLEAGRPDSPARIAHRLLSAYGRKDPSLHDPCVIAHLIDPALFTGASGRISVECTDAMNLGQTRLVPGEGVRIMTDGDAPRFFALLAERLGKWREAGGES